MYQRIPVPKNRAYSKILFILASRPRIISHVSKLLTKTNSAVHRQIKILEKEDYVINTSKRLYAVNWDTIVSAFIIFLTNYAKQKEKRYSLFKEYLDQEEHNETWINVIFKDVFDALKPLATPEFQDKIRKNETLKQVFRWIFMSHQLSNLSLEDVFTEFIQSLAWDEDILSKRNTSADFREYVKLIRAFQNLSIDPLTRIGSALGEYIAQHNEKKRWYS